ncbi:DUF554 domain-containing protein [Pseudogracilibacillus sp. SO30301A]|uniref:DUF554 domain-containing protein n=1 Tax=Pseudogracilibacillus sp. SO30301A TaxID=3098291 RepID=UPI00300E5452
MVLFGTIVNGICIVIGSLIGLFMTKINDKYKETIIQGIGLTILLIGLQMALQVNSIIIVLLSMLTGAIVGELFRLEELLNRLGYWVSRRLTNKDDNINVSQAFVTASLLFVVGAMAILGALDSGLRGDHEVLLTKSVLDGFTAFILTTTLGIGVILSVIPVVLFQGSIALLASQIEKLIPEEVFNDLLVDITAVGGLLIVAIGLNLLKLTQIRVTNLLPAIFMVVVFVYLNHMLFIN